MGRAINFPVSSLSIANHLGVVCLGVPMEVYGASSLDDAKEGDLCFLKSDSFINKIRPSTVVITTVELAAFVVARGALAISSAKPRLDFAIALSYLEDVCGFIWSDDEPLLHPTVKLGANVVLGRGVRIGAHSRVLNNAVIGDEVVIGERCVIKSCAVIGEDGFGYERTDDGRAIRLPHIGNVIIENDVEVGSLTTVCRGTLGNTVLRDGAKIDDHVHIAHNVVVGRHAFVIACAEISGGVIIGEAAWVAPCATIKNQVIIGDRAVIGLGAVVLRDVANDQVIVGNPGKVLEK